MGKGKKGSSIKKRSLIIKKGPRAPLPAFWVLNIRLMGLLTINFVYWKAFHITGWKRGVRGGGRIRTEESPAQSSIKRLGRRYWKENVGVTQCFPDSSLKYKALKLRFYITAMEHTIFMSIARVQTVLSSGAMLATFAIIWAWAGKTSFGFFFSN